MVIAGDDNDSCLTLDQEEERAIAATQQQAPVIIDPLAEFRENQRQVVPPAEPRQPPVEPRQPPAEPRQPPAKRLRPLTSNQPVAAAAAAPLQSTSRQPLPQAVPLTSGILHPEVSQQQMQQTVSNYNLPREVTDLINGYNSSQARLLSTIDNLSAQLRTANQQQSRTLVHAELEEEAEPLATDPAMWLQGNFSDVRDNSTDVLNYELRLGLRNPCAPPSTWWTPSKMQGARKVTPVRGSSLEVEHIFGCEGPAASTVKYVNII